MSTTLPHSIGSLTRRYPCWPHSGVYHSPKWQPDTTNDARLIPTRCNNVLPTSPGPHTHMKPVGLALPPLPVLNFLKTSSGLNWVIRTPVFENSDSISRIFPRRTQWHSPFHLIQTLKFNSDLFYIIASYSTYGVLHSPLLKGFRPRNL